jgi:CRISPR/Cas system-associated endoribonuclease Cas2
MGKIEQEARVGRRRINIQKVVLRTVATAGLLSVALLAPNALQMLQSLDGKKKRRFDPKYLIGNAFEKLLARGMLEFTSGETGRFIRLTEIGKRKLGGMIARSPDSRMNKRWDKRWRVVIYDIREKRKVTRNRLQRTLSSFGFCKLQNSVWVYPFECEELIILLKADFKIGKEVLYMVVEKIENDTPLKKYFNLR